MMNRRRRGNIREEGREESRRSRVEKGREERRRMGKSQNVKRVELQERKGRPWRCQGQECR